MKNYLAFCIFLLSLQAKTQNLPYAFDVDSNVYQALLQPIPLSNGLPWDDLTITADFGFPFEFFGQSTNQLVQQADFAINLFGFDSNVSNAFIAYGADLVDRGYNSGQALSPIAYLIDGTSGQKIYKIEWDNAGFFDDASNEDYINLQVWFYEGTNVMEVHFGPSVTSHQSDFISLTGPLVGFVSHLSLDEGTFNDLWYLEGEVDHPTLKHLKYPSIDTLFYTLNGSPGDGLVYRFSPLTVQTHQPEIFTPQIKVYPSLVTRTVRVEWEKAENLQEWQWTLLSPEGNVEMIQQSIEPVEEIDLSGRPAGLYCLKIESPGHSSVLKKIIKV